MEKNRAGGRGDDSSVVPIYKGVFPASVGNMISGFGTVSLPSTYSGMSYGTAHPSFCGTFATHKECRNNIGM